MSLASIAGLIPIDLRRFSALSIEFMRASRRRMDEEKLKIISRHDITDSEDDVTTLALSH